MIVLKTQNGNKVERGQIVFLAKDKKRRKCPDKCEK